MSWLHQGYTQPVLFLQPETFKIEDAAKDSATVLILKLERMPAKGCQSCLFCFPELRTPDKVVTVM